MPLIDVLIMVSIVAICATVPLLCVLLIQDIMLKNIRRQTYQRAIDEVKTVEEYFRKSMKASSNEDGSRFSFFLDLDDDDKKVH